MEQKRGNTGKSVTRPTRFRSWCFTLNNPSQNEAKELSQTLAQIAHQFVFQEEKGENGTEHLQGVVRWKNPQTFAYIKSLLPKAHIERCKSWKRSIVYCSKDLSRCGGIYTNIATLKPFPDPFAGREPLPWMVPIFDLLKLEPDDRTIHWYWEAVGNVGKSSLVKKLYHDHPDCTLALSGAAAKDCLYAVAQFAEKNNPKIVLFDFPRTREEYVSYEAIEMIKNGLFFSSKYESKMCRIHVPHIVVLANFAPNLDKLSLDRWNIVNIVSY